MAKEANQTPPGDRSSLAHLHVWQIQAVRDLLFVAAVVGIVGAGYALRAVTVPLLVALLLAYLFEPLIERLCRHPRITRTMAVGGLLGTIVITMVVVVALAIPLIVGQTRQLIGDVRSGDVQTRLAGLEDKLPATFRDEYRHMIDLLPAREAGRPPDTGTAESTAGDVEGADAAPAPGPGALTEAETRALIEEILADRAGRPPESATGSGNDADWRNLVDDARRSAATIVGAIGAVVGIGLLLFLIPFYFFFFSLWYPSVVAFARELIPERSRGRAVELLEKMDAVIAGFVRGRIVISLIMGVLLAIGWAIFGVPYSITLGLVVGIFCAVPYLGVIGIPLAVGLLFVDQLGEPVDARMAWWGILLWPTLVFAVVQLIEGYALTPMIAGKATNLDPVTILVAVLAGGSVLGVYGMILAIPAAACAKILFTDVLLPRIRAWTRGEVADPLPIERG